MSPSIPPEIPDETQPTTSRVGRLSIAIFVVVVALLFVQGSLKQHLTNISPRVVLLSFAALMALCVAGLICGIVGACGWGKRRQPVFGIVGTLLNGLILFIAITNFQTGRTRALETQRKLEQTFADVRQNAKASYNTTNEMETGLKSMNQLKKTFEKASAGSSGSDKLFYQASAGYATKMQAAMTSFTEAAKGFIGAEILKAYTVSGKDELRPKRQAVAQFLTANDAFSSFLSRADEVFSNEMVNANASAPVVAKGVAAFAEGQKSLRPLLLKMRALDSEAAHLSIQLIDLLETNWGSWKCDRATGQLIAEESRFRTNYNYLVQRFGEIQKDEAATQATVINPR